MPGKKDAAWWRDYRARKKVDQGGVERSDGDAHAACDRLERELRAEIQRLTMTNRDLKRALDDLDPFGTGGGE